MNKPWSGGTVLLWLVLAGGVRADEARTVAALEKLGARIQRDEEQPGKPVVRVDLSGQVPQHPDQFANLKA